MFVRGRPGLRVAARGRARPRFLSMGGPRPACALGPLSSFVSVRVRVCVYFGEEWNLFLGKLSLFLSSSVALSRCGHGCVENARGVSFIRQS